MKQGQLGLAELKAARSRGSVLMWAVFLFSIFVNILMLTGPLFMMQVYDRVLGSRSEETLTALCILVAILYILMGLLDYARGRVLARYGARFQAALDLRTFDAAIKKALHPDARSKPATGLRDLEAMQSLFTSPVMLALFDIPWTPVFIAAIFIFHPMLGWMAVGGGAFLIVLAIANNLLTRSKAATAQMTAQQAHGFVEQARHSSEIVRSQGMNTSVALRWQGMRQQALEQKIHASDWGGLFTAFTKAFRLLLQSAMLAVGAWLVLQNEMTAGAMIAGSILLGRALAPIEQTIGQWPLVQAAARGWTSLATLLQEAPPETETLKLPKPAARIAVKGMTLVAPGAKQPTLSNISFTIEPGQVLGVIGKSGSGKSTLAKALLGLMPVSAGEIRIGGATLAQYSLDDLGSHIGYLPQQVTLFTGTVADNIARLSTNPDEAKIVEAAKRANAHEMILALPDGYDTVVQGQDSQLSGGQRQRIGLARAFYNDPVLLVLDEPNSALDNDGSVALNKAIREFKNSERAVILMTHRPGAISECDRLLMMEQGRVMAFGPKDEVLKKVLQNPETVRRNLSQVAS